MIENATTPIDPFIGALQAELAAHNVALPQDMNPDMVFLSGLSRSLLNREREIADTVAWTDTRIATLRREIESIKELKLPEAMGCVRRLAKGKSKSVKVPGMQFGTKTVPPKVEWAPEDSAAVIAWAEGNCPDALTTYQPDPRTTVKKTALLAYHDRTGRTPHCCRYVMGGEQPYAKPTKKKEGADDE